MRRNEVDYLLGTLLDFNKDVSDIIFTVDRPPQVEVAGQLLAVPTQPPMPTLTPFQTEMIALNLIAGNQRLIDDLLGAGAGDSSYTLGDQARMRNTVLP